MLLYSVNKVPLCKNIKLVVKYQESFINVYIDLKNK